MGSPDQSNTEGSREMTEPIYPCQKCGQPFALSQLHSHFSTCRGPPQLQAPQQSPQLQTWLNTPFQQAPQPQQYQYPYPPLHPNSPLLVPVAVPEHQHSWIKNREYEWCADPSCHRLRLHLRGWWFLFVRYGFKLFWIQMLIALAVAFTLASTLGIRR